MPTTPPPADSEPAVVAPVEEEPVEEAPAEVRYRLVYEAGEQGSIQGESEQSVEDGREGAAVVAVPTEGYHFLGWSDGVESAERVDADVSADLSVTAQFARNQYTLTYGMSGKGTLEGQTEQVVDHGEDALPVKAVPAEHYHFVGWSDGVATPERIDRNVTQDMTVTARFVIDQYTLTYRAGDNGSIEGQATQKINRGEASIAVTAVPQEGYRFERWSDGVATARRIDRNVTADATVMAEFVPNSYTLTYAAEGRGKIQGDNSQIVDLGSDGSEVTAIPDRGYQFVAWSDGVETETRIDSNVQKDLTVSALFAVKTFAVGGRLSGLIEGTELVLQNNGSDDLTINANGDFVFSTKLLDGDAYSVTVLIQPSSPNQTCTVSYGEDRVDGRDITDIEIECVLKTYRIGGQVSGLPQGDRIVLRNNGGDDLTLEADGRFVFATPLDDGSEYAVSVHKYPARPNWTCTVDQGTGTLGGQDVADVDVACFVKAVLQAKAGINQVRMNWNAEDFSNVTFNLCRAREDITGQDFSTCAQAGGVLESGVSTGHIASGLVNDVPYWFQLEVRHANDRRSYSDVVKALPFGGLNDTGIDWCADHSTNRGMDGTRIDKAQGCEELSATQPRQDGHLGRDAEARARTLKKKGSGAAGFDFTKVCASGEKAGEGKCPPNPAPGSGRTNWACTLDNTTGLMWEIKAENGLRNAQHTYTWHNPSAAVNGGEPGVPGGGTCTDSRCDTQAFVQAVNFQTLCGARDWRLPTRKELLSIVDNGRINPAIDTGFFPAATASYFWTSSPYADQANSAWLVYFLYGEAYPENKNQAKSVRLVRGRTVTFGLENP